MLIHHSFTMAGSAEEEMNWPQTFFHDDVLSVRVN